MSADGGCVQFSEKELMGYPAVNDGHDERVSESASEERQVKEQR